MPNPYLSAVDPEHIAISRSTGIKIDWKDGHHSEYELQFLRDRCPCAGCAGEQEPPDPPQLLPLYKPKLKMHKVEPVGAYALRVEWNDGHNSGIYTFDYLREICPCPDCRTDS